MLGIGIPQFGPEASASGDIWAGVVAAVVLVVTLAAALWIYVRSRPDRPERHDEVTQLPKAA
jgi:hypothetical protein